MFTNHSPLLKVLNLFLINFLTYSEKKEIVQDSKLSLLYVTSELLKDNARKGKVFRCSSIPKIIKRTFTYMLHCLHYRLVFTRKTFTFLSCQLSKAFNIIYLNLNVKRGFFFYINDTFANLLMLTYFYMLQPFVEEPFNTIKIISLKVKDVLILCSFLKSLVDVEF